MRRRFWLLYPAWMLICAALFFAFRGREDPSRRHDRILSEDAATRAVSILRRRDPARYRTYEPVHVAYAGPLAPKCVDTALAAALYIDQAIIVGGTRVCASL